MAEGNDRITVSRDALRAELSDLELRLVDRLSTALEHKADAAVLEGALARIQALELQRAERAHLPGDVSDLDSRVGSLERFRWAIPSTALVSVVVAAVVAADRFIP